MSPRGRASRPARSRAGGATPSTPPPHLWGEAAPSRKVVLGKFSQQCAGSDLARAQWLAATFKITLDEARANDSNVLARACDGGHLHIAKWLVAMFKLMTQDVRGRHC